MRMFFADLSSEEGDLLLDEYDVPIAKASSNGYYNQMLDVMKGIMSTALKIIRHYSFLL